MSNFNEYECIGYIQGDIKGQNRVFIIRKCDLYDRNQTNSNQGLQAKNITKYRTIITLRFK